MSSTVSNLRVIFLFSRCCRCTHRFLTLARSLPLYSLQLLDGFEDISNYVVERLFCRSSPSRNESQSPSKTFSSSSRPKEFVFSFSSSSLQNAHVDNAMDCNSTPQKRRRQTNQALEALGQLIKDSFSEEIDEKLNKNDILSLTISRLLRRRYYPSNLINRKYSTEEKWSEFSCQSDTNFLFFSKFCVGARIRRWCVG